MRILLISLLFLLTECISYPKKSGFVLNPPSTNSNTNPYFSNSEADYVYKAQIEAFQKNFSGILAIKKLGASHQRVIFVTEIGNTIFDFGFKRDEFYVNKIIKGLNRKIVINLLKRDFYALILENPKIEETFKKDSILMQKGSILGKKHYYLSKNGELSKIIRTGNEQEKVIIHFHKVSVNVAKEIIISHKKIKLNINLKAI